MAWPSMPSFDSMDPVTLEVLDLLLAFLLLSGEEAFRIASPMLDRVLPSWDVTLFVFSTAGSDVLIVDSGSPRSVGTEAVRLVLNSVGDRAVGTVCDCSLRITG